MHSWISVKCRCRLSRTREEISNGRNTRFHALYTYCYIMITITIVCAKMYQDEKSESIHTHTHTKKIYKTIECLCFGGGVKMPTNRQVGGWASTWEKTHILTHTKKNTNVPPSSLLPTSQVQWRRRLHQPCVDGLSSISLWRRCDLEGDGTRAQQPRT